MPCLLFSCPPEKRVAGCLEAIRVRGPFMSPVPTQTVRVVQQGNQQIPMTIDGRPVQPKNGQWYVADAVKAWNWIVTQKLPFPPNTNFVCEVEDWYMRPTPTPEFPIPDIQPVILGMEQTQQPQVQRTVVEAPTMQPTGNPGGSLEAPLSTGVRDPFNFETLSDGALPRTADPMVDVDPEGGTYTDVTVVGGKPVEAQRQYTKTYQPRPTP